jgi:biopolymer transport protein ExbB/TolQ
MSNETKVVRGGFRATLALIISIIALIVAIVAYNRTSDEAYFKDQIKDLQARMNTLKEETSERVTKVRQETAKALEKIGIEIKRQEGKE